MSILITDLTDIQQTLQNTFQEKFQLTDYDNAPGPLVLAAGNSIRVGGSLYYITNGDYTVTDNVPTPTTGTTPCYIYLSDVGGGIGAATLEDDIPTFDPNKAGYYFGNARAIFSMSKDSSNNFINRVRLVDAELKRAHDRQLIYSIIF